VLPVVCGQPLVGAFGKGLHDGQPLVGGQLGLNSYHPITQRVQSDAASAFVLGSALLGGFPVQPVGVALNQGA
jgi:hypothetical protein